MLTVAAVKYEIHGHGLRNEVYIEQRKGHLGVRWCVSSLSSRVLNKDHEWEFEPMPSSRDDEFFGRTRFDSLDDALEAFAKSLPKLLESGE